jgi:hypothetical protein
VFRRQPFPGTSFLSSSLLSLSRRAYLSPIDKPLRYPIIKRIIHGKNIQRDHCASNPKPKLSQTQSLPLQINESTTPSSQQVQESSGGCHMRHSRSCCCASRCHSAARLNPSNSISAPGGRYRGAAWQSPYNQICRAACCDLDHVHCRYTIILS